MKILITIAAENATRARATATRHYMWDKLRGFVNKPIRKRVEKQFYMQMYVCMRNRMRIRMPLTYISHGRL